MECLKKKYQFILQYVHFPGKGTYRKKSGNTRYLPEVYVRGNK